MVRISVLRKSRRRRARAFSRALSSSLEIVTRQKTLASETTLYHKFNARIPTCRFTGRAHGRRGRRAAAGPSHIAFSLSLSLSTRVRTVRELQLFPYKRAVRTKPRARERRVRSLSSQGGQTYRERLFLKNNNNTRDRPSQLWRAQLPQLASALRREEEGEDGRLRRRRGEYALVFEGSPLHYWRLCAIDVRGRRLALSLSLSLSRGKGNKARAAARARVRERERSFEVSLAQAGGLLASSAFGPRPPPASLNFTVDGAPIALLVGACDTDPEQLARGWCREHTGSEHAGCVKMVAARAALTLDALRLHRKPSRLSVRLGNGAELAQEINVGDDARALARARCAEWGLDANDCAQLTRSLRELLPAEARDWCLNHTRATSHPT